VKGKKYLFLDNEAFRPKYSKGEDFVSAVEVKTIEILGKFLKKEKYLMDKILGKDSKCLNRVFDIAQIGHGERLPLAYTRSAKPSVEHVTHKKRVVLNFLRRLLRSKRPLLFLVMRSLRKVMKIWARGLLVD
jgi:hypothetical protein